MKDKKQGSFQSLPHEVVSQVFTLCLDSDSAPNSPVLPLVLGAVCSYWRQVAYNLPVLWSTLVIGGSSGKGHLTKASLEGWLGRSRLTPLSVTIKRGCCICCNWEELIDVATSHCGRWDELDCSLMSFEAERVLEGISKAGGTPLLKNISFGLLDAGPFELSLKVPWSLRSIFLPGAIHLSGMVPDKPQHNLRRLYYSINTWEEYLRYLPLFPNLEDYGASCTSMSSSIATPFPEGGKHLIHSNIKELHFWFRASVLAQDLGRTLDHLELPALTKFFVTCFPRERADCEARPWPHLNSLIVRSKARIESLCVYGVLLQDKDIFNCMRSAPSLRIVDTRILATDENLKTLTVSQSTPGSNIGTSVEVMAIACTRNMEVGPFLDMVRSRCRGNDATPLRQIYLSRRFGEHIPVHQEFKEQLDDDGLRGLGGLEIKLGQYAKDYSMLK